MIERLCAVLTPRQRQVLRLMARHLSHKEIAAELNVGFKTTKDHMVAIYDRLVDGRNTDVLSLVLGAVNHPAPTNFPCRWCSNPDEDRFVYHFGECPERRGLNVLERTGE